MTEIRARFQAHVARVLERARDDFDVRKGNNHWTRARFDELAPGLHWSS